MSNINELSSLLRSNYDLLYLVTHEEDRAIDDIANVAEKMGLGLVSWTFASGAKVLKGNLTTTVETTSSGKVSKQNVKIVNGDSVGHPVRILSMMRECKENAILILNDYHAYLKDAEVVRELKDCLSKLKSTYNPVIIISPTLKVPVEIEKLATVVEYALPSKDEITLIVNALCEKIADSGQFTPISDKVKAEIIEACQGLTLKEVENVTMRSLTEDGTLNPSAVMHQKKQIIKKSGILEYYEVSESMNDVGGMDIMKDWLMKRRSAFSEDAKRFGLPIPKGVLMLGIPGCGKTLMCKAVSKAWNMPLLRFDVGAVMSGLVGSSEENMRKVIQTAEASAPCILWCDEIEKGLSGTGSSNFSDAGTTSRVFATFLTWLNEKKSQVFVVATANDVSQLPPELLRKGRFDETFFVDLPSFEERKEIFAIHLTKKHRDPSRFDLNTLAENSEGFSGADICAAIESSLFDVFTDDMGQVDISDLNILKSLRETTPLSTMMKEQIEKLKSWCHTNRARLASSKTGGI